MARENNEERTDLYVKATRNIRDIPWDQRTLEDYKTAYIHSTDDHALTQGKIRKNLGEHIEMLTTAHAALKAGDTHVTDEYLGRTIRRMQEHLDSLD